MANLKAGLIQMGLKGDTSMDPEGTRTISAKTHHQTQLQQ